MSSLYSPYTVRIDDGQHEVWYAGMDPLVEMLDGLGWQTLSSPDARCSDFFAQASEADLHEIHGARSRLGVQATDHTATHWLTAVADTDLWMAREPLIQAVFDRRLDRDPGAPDGTITGHLAARLGVERRTADAVMSMFFHLPHRPPARKGDRFPQLPAPDEAGPRLLARFRAAETGGPALTAAGDRWISWLFSGADSPVARWSAEPCIQRAAELFARLSDGERPRDRDWQKAQEDTKHQAYVYRPAAAGPMADRPGMSREERQEAVKQHNLRCSWHLAMSTVQAALGGDMTAAGRSLDASMEWLARGNGFSWSDRLYDAKANGWRTMRDRFVEFLDQAPDLAAGAESMDDSMQPSL